MLVTSRPSNRISPDGRLDQAQNAAPGRRLAAAGLADKAERLARRDVERDAVDGMHMIDHALQKAAA